MINSLTGSLWQLNEPLYREVLAIKQRFNLPEVIAQIVANKNIKLEDIDSFLEPSLKILLPDPSHLIDMDKSVERIITTLSSKEKVVIFGDYDVDGATSSALIKRYFDAIGIESITYIPDRINEGYGPNATAFKKFKTAGFGLCITVDCGTVAHEPLKEAKDCDLDVIVVDHHISMDTLPEAFAIINPNRIDQQSNCTDLAAVGVSFLLLVAINRKLKEVGYFQHIATPNLLHYLDLVALGTVCDVVKLSALNRAFVHQGLKIISRRGNLGIRSLSDVLKINTIISSYHLGFMFGPCINAGGRISDSNLGTKLLSTSDELEAYNIATTLKGLNDERKELEKNTLEEALLQIQHPLNENFIMVHDKWHPGVIGIVASRIKDRYHLPTFIISIKDGIGKSSARSIEGVNIGAVILSAKLEGLLIEGGGHAMAGGFSIKEEMIPALHSYFKKRFSSINVQRVIKFDGFISISGINSALMKQISVLEPFGSGNKEPLFVIKNVEFSKIKSINDEHIICQIADSHSKKTIKGLAFKAFKNNIAENIMSHKATMILCKLQNNFFNGVYSPEIVIEDIA